MDFVAVDVETANASLASVCQVGIALFSGGELADEWQSYVDPEDVFDPFNVAVHGITPETVAGAPNLAAIAESIGGLLGGNVVVSHTAFDRVSLDRAFARYEAAMPACTWLDSAKVARRVWKECARSGYGLGDVCALIGYDFRHHDALEDAKAAGRIIVEAARRTGEDLDGLLRLARRPITPRKHTKHKSYPSAPITRSGDPEGPLFGEVLVFTGQLSMPRHEAADLAAAAGCQVADYVGKKTTLLVLGDQDVRRLNGHEKSSKHRRAEELIAAGHPLRILSESDFLHLIGAARPSEAL